MPERHYDVNSKCLVDFEFPRQELSLLLGMRGALGGMGLAILGATVVRACAATHSCAWRPFSVKAVRKLQTTGH